MGRKNKLERKKTGIPVTMVLIALLSVALLIMPVLSAKTTISIGDVFVEPGNTTVTSIIINNVTNLGVADINITYDPSVVHVTTVTNSDFGSLYPVIDNSAGLVRIGGIDDGDGLSGSVKVATLALKAVGNANEKTSFGISINELKEASAEETSIPALVDNGTAILNLPPVAIARSMHRYNNIGSSYPCKAIFDGSASYDLSSTGSITSYKWDFGDGQSREGKIVEHVYATCKWNGTGYEPFDVFLTVKDDGNLTNTTIIKTNVFIAGDANGDGEVNIIDAAMVGREWKNKCKSHCWEGEDWADRADLNNDCEVNILDAAIIGRNWRDTAW